MNLQYKHTKLEDLNQIVSFAQNIEESFYLFNLHHQLDLETLKTFYHKRIDNTTFFLNGEIIGFANFYRYKQDHISIIYLGNVVVAPAHRTKGYSKMILEVMEHKAKTQHQAIHLRIAVFDENKIAKKLYKNSGFHLINMETRRDDHNKICTICIMGKVI